MALEEFAKNVWSISVLPKERLGWTQSHSSFCSITSMTTTAVVSHATVEAPIDRYDFTLQYQVFQARKLTVIAVQNPDACHVS